MKSRLLLSLLAALLLAPVLALVVAPRAEAEPSSAESNSVATCLQSGRSLSALFLFDQSGSLGGSDATGIRYDGLRLALQSLSRVSRPDGQAVPVEVAVSAFDHQYRDVGEIVGWTRINNADDKPDSAAIDSVVNRARERTQPGGGTDFNAAMNGAFEDMKDRASRGACRVVFWFTDGEDEGLVKAVDSQTCAPNTGVVDQMRKEGISVVGLQLGPPNVDLEAISTGASTSATTSGVTCGRNPIPTDWAGGVYIQADDPAALRRLFGNLGNLLKGCVPQGDRHGLIDKGVGGMNVTIQTSSAVNMVRLDAPDGTVISAPTHGTMTESGYTVNAESDPTFVSLTVDFPPGKGDGEWTVSAGQAIAESDVEYCVFSGLHLTRVDPAASPAAGKPAEVLYAVLDRDGKPADLGLYRAIAPSAAVVGSDGKPRKAKAERRGDQIALRFDSEPTDLRLQVGVTAVLTTSSGLELAPLAVDEGLGMTLSKDFPTITPVEEMDLGTAVNKEAARTDLTLLGSPNGPTKICFESPEDVVVPDAVSGQKLGVPSGCVDLAKGETKTVSISVQTDTPTIGNGEALLPIRLHPVEGSPMAGKVAEVDVPVLWRYENPISQPRLWGLLALILAISLILPLATLSLVNFLTAKFTVRGLKGAQIPVLIDDSGPRRVTELLNKRVLDLYNSTPVSIANRRKFTYGPVEFSRRVSLLPWVAPTFTARATAPGHRVLSSVGPSTDPTVAPVAPGLGFVVLAVVADADLQNAAVTEVPAQLVFLTRDEALASEQLDELMNSRMDWRTITERWREGVDFRSARGARTNDPAAGDDLSFLDDQGKKGPDDFGSMDFLD